LHIFVRLPVPGLFFLAKRPNHRRFHSGNVMMLKGASIMQHDKMNPRDRDERINDAMDRDEREKDSTEFYEAMPGTMDNRYVARSTDETPARRSLLPWLLIPLALLLGLILWGMLSSNTTPTNTNTGAAPQQQSNY
jgi:hypothetical protein